MALDVKDASGTPKSLAVGGGAGTSGSPFISPLKAAVGDQADSPAADDTGAYSLFGFVKRLLGKLPSLVSGRTPVVIKDFNDGDYEMVPASTTDQPLGATGAVGDWLAGLLIVPATTSPGSVTIKDGSGSAMPVFTGGASSVNSLVPFFVPMGAISGSGGWKVSTGSAVSVIAFGNFS